MLADKEVAMGLLEPEQVAPPDSGLDITADTTRGIDPRTRQVHLDSGATRACEALIIASGSSHHVRTRDHPALPQRRPPHA